MAVPKRKMSRSNTRHRRSAWKTTATTLVDCANQALDELKADGTLQAIQDKWLSQSANAPTLD